MNTPLAPEYAILLSERISILRNELKDIEAILKEKQDQFTTNATSIKDLEATLSMAQAALVTQKQVLSGAALKQLLKTGLHKKLF